MTPAMDRYWAKVDKSGGPDACWPWTGYRNERGYGYFRAEGRSVRAHRWGYEQRIGPIPIGHELLHHCDNRACQNDRHWSTGTHAENMADMVHRARAGRMPGETHPSHILTEGQVREIRDRYNAGGVTQAALAAEYGVRRVTIGAIVRRRLWRHIP